MCLKAMLARIRKDENLVDRVQGRLCNDPINWSQWSKPGPPPTTGSKDMVPVKITHLAMDLVQLILQIGIVVTLSAVDFAA